MLEASRFTLSAPSSFEGPAIKGSRFPAFAQRIADEAEAASFVRSIREQHPGLRHCCWAYRLHDGAYRSSDDGEPGGSAGRPILAQLEGAQLVDACVAVVRYSGGIKLGVGGLIRAYAGAAREVLKQAQTLAIIAKLKIEVICAYSDQALVEHLFRDAQIVERLFAASVTLRLSVAAESLQAQEEKLQELSAGRVMLRVLTSDVS